MITLKEAKQRLYTFDTIGKKKNGNFIARREFFYTHGVTIQQKIAEVKKAFPNANIVDSGEVWKSFRGGASTANSSHWYVEFNFPKGDQK